MDKVVLFLIIVIIWVALWSLITMFINELLISLIIDVDPFVVRFVAYILIALIGFLILIASNNLDSLV